MTPYKVRLEVNHPFSEIELEYLPTIFDSPDCMVKIENDGNYYLTACRFEKLTDKEITESAKKLITMIAAFAKIELGEDFQGIESDDINIISIIQKTDESAVYVQSDVATASAKWVIPHFEVKDGKQVPRERQERWYDFYLNQCDDRIDNTVMFEALSYFAERTTPRTLRLTYEVIRNDEGGKERLSENNDWVTIKELNPFVRRLRSPLHRWPRVACEKSRFKQQL